MNGSNHISYVAVVDDDESVCRSLGRLLRTAGFHPVTYLSAEAFLEDRKRPRFDCMLLDIQLGGISGLELSHRLAAVNDDTPVVFITWSKPWTRPPAVCSANQAASIRSMSASSTRTRSSRKWTSPMSC